MIDTIYTIGYSGFKIDDFVKTHKENGVSVVIDVRSLPYSQFYSDYNKENLSRILEVSKIYYRNYVAEFGARQENRDFYPNGYLDFEMFARSEVFLSGFEKIKKSMQKGFVIALMCSEKDPIKCHRTILVARAFHNAGYKVIHLLPEGQKITQEEIEERLLNMFFPDRGQINMFAPMLSTEEYIDEAYKKQNASIGYSIEGET